MDFLDFFELKEYPFRLTPDPAYFFPSSSHKEGLLLMDYAIDQKEGILLIIGGPGTGKTTMLKVFLEKWKSQAETAMILTPRLSPEECLISIAEDLKISLENKSKNEIIKALRDFMTVKSKENKRVIIILDEAQNLPADTLEELRLLSNLETDKDKLIQIILIGQPELEEKLMTEKLRQLNQRITTRIHLRQFGQKETMDYIDYRSIKAGKRKLQINKKVGRLIYKYSNGTPKLINMVISRTLMAAFLEESTTILPRHLYHATKSLKHSDIKIKKSLRPALAAAGIFLVLFVVSASVFFYMQQNKMKNSAHLITAPAVEKTDTIEPVELAEDQTARETVTPSLEEDITGPAPDETITDKTVTDETVTDDPAQPVADGNIAGEAEAIITANEQEQIPDDNPMPDIRLVSVKVSVANIRKSPSVDAGKIGQTYRHNQFLVLNEYIDDQNTTWYLVPFQEEKGWISGWIVNKVDINEMVREESEMVEEGHITEADTVNPDAPVKEDPDNIPDRGNAVLQEARAESGSGQPRDNLQISEE
ncbi:MAG: AAA family ATPase [Nitrospirota bacterium]